MILDLCVASHKLSFISSVAGPISSPVVTLWSVVVLGNSVVIETVLVGMFDCLGSPPEKLSS